MKTGTEVSCKIHIETGLHPGFLFVALCELSWPRAEIWKNPPLPEKVTTLQASIHQFQGQWPVLRFALDLLVSVVWVLECKEL